MGRLEAGEAPGQGIQNQFVEAQQIDFCCSGPWEAEAHGRESKINLLRLNKLMRHPGRESKMNLLRLNKLNLVVPGGGKAGGLGRHPGRESKINLLRLNKLILVVPGGGKAGSWGGTRAGNPKSIC